MNKYNINNYSIEKDNRFIAYVDEVDANQIVKLLNKQEEQIKKLEKQNQSQYNSKLKTIQKTIKKTMRYFLRWCK